MRICELKQKEVINCCDCKMIGSVEDLEFDICTGCIEACLCPGLQNSVILYVAILNI